jgi:hypothetical protein
MQLTGARRWAPTSLPDGRMLTAPTSASREDADTGLSETDPRSGPIARAANLIKGQPSLEATGRTNPAPGSEMLAEPRG